MATQTETTIDALVIGAGPTGLLMAAELTRHGVSCRIFDKAPAPSRYSKALAIQSRTLEIFDQIGIIDGFLEAGLQTPKIHLFADGQPLISMSMRELPGPYPFILCLPQSETERILGKHLTGLGVQVERQVELVGFSQDESSATATVRHADGHTETVTARWLIGCDGAHSTVRHILNIPFSGAPYPEAFALADVKIDWTLPNNEIHIFLSKDGMLAAFPMRGERYRLIVETKADAGDEQLPDPTLEEIQTYLTTLGPVGSVASDPAWLSAFRTHLREAKHTRQERVFLAGDAAHIHSPAGGQGMNTGLQDAYNLAWKLALVNAGHAPASLLDTYELERHPVAESVMRTSDLMLKAATLRSPITQQIRNRLLPLLAQQDFFQHRMTGQLAELSTNYRKSPIVAEHSSGHLAHLHPPAGPKAGDRAPEVAPLRLADGTPSRLFELLRSPTHTLLLFSGAKTDDSAQQRLVSLAESISRTRGKLITSYLVAAEEGALAPSAPGAALLLDPTLALHHAYAAVSECLYLIRPDGYIGFRSFPADEASLQAHLDRIFSPDR
jgi:2-polyprenyl-6-methoxyphenol hydroxylase-like FAD-dependent oxidoreductase